MEFAAFADLVTKYGPLVIVAFVIWTGWKREERSEARATENASALQKIAVDTTKAISDITNEVRGLRSDIQRVPCVLDQQNDGKRH